MPIITVKTGPYKGKYTSLWDLLDLQSERMATCPHEGQTRDESGTTGRNSPEGPRKWSRVRCLDCNGIVPGTFKREER